jgi:hypothetical protein
MHRCNTLIVMRRSQMPLVGFREGIGVEKLTLPYEDKYLKEIS